MLHRFRLVLPALLIATAGLQAQGLYWESTSTGGPVPGGKPRTAKNYAAPKKFKIDQGDNIVIVRLDQEKMYMVDPKAKTYSEMTFEDLEGAAKAMKAQLEMMKKQLENMPPEQRAAMEKQLGPALRAGKDTKVEVEKASEKRDIAGKPTMKHVVKEDGKETAVLWVTDDVKEYKTLKADFSVLMKRMSTLNPGMKGLASAAEKIEGFPLETDMKENGQGDGDEGRAAVHSRFRLRGPRRLHEDGLAARGADRPAQGQGQGQGKGQGRGDSGEEEGVARGPSPG